jgi:hypothetical protein
MLIGGNALEGESLYRAANKTGSFCNFRVKKYFDRMIVESYIYLSIALSMDNTKFQRHHYVLKQLLEHDTAYAW